MGIIPKTTIIEFNGLPGVGKSTITHYLEELANKQGIPFYKKYYRYSFEHRTISLLLRPLLFSLLPSIMLYANCYRSGMQKNRYIVGFLAYVREYLDFKKDIKNGLLVSDQGIVQDFISIAHDSSIKDLGTVSSILSKLEKRNIRFIRVDCNLSEVDVLNRLRNRVNGGSRIEKNDDDEVIRLLNIQKRNLELVRQELNKSSESFHITIDTSVSPYDNACFIWKMIYGKTEK